MISTADILARSSSILSVGAFHMFLSHGSTSTLEPAELRLQRLRGNKLSLLSHVHRSSISSISDSSRSLPYA